MSLVNFYFLIFIITIFTFSRQGASQESHYPHHVNITWKIENWDSNRESAKNLISPKFTANTHDTFKWFLSVTFHDYGAISVALYADSANEEKEADARYSISVLNKRREPGYTLQTEHHFFNGPYTQDPAGDNWGWTNYIILDDDFEKKYVIQNSVTLLLQLEFSSKSDPREGSLTESDVNSLSVKLDFSMSNISGESGMLVDLLLKNNGCADAIIVADGKEYPAHKIILASKSKVLSDMFDKVSPTHPGEPIRIDLGDMKPKVVIEILKYVYLGKSQPTKETADALLEMATKFKFDDLKNSTFDILSKSITVKDAPLIFDLASKYHNDKLKSDVIEEILSKSSKDPHILCELCTYQHCQTY